ncbi:hypothetical protein ASPVEDRAFT_28585 [Aspergillus versicolor CBS 583.65]|uniref:Capsule synthesis protein CapA domain-containing protein n=1 Tax=Aspergillus versicolor CBS 583.65 TaxID=1036611 RepID=A0A1L9PKA0_ASPVE|nr:uncharacterized protein ASPVEDRAFT_28585 [Aspergillus versicolor CBS 583.65]OJJ01959.1 hypothetical protein ASPVEDRAFT_28585 [Aspergillus versicolor CBS 583.65]
MHLISSASWKWDLLALTATALIRPLSAAQPCGTSWSIAATGDFLGEVVLSEDPRTTAVWDLVRSADFGFFNMEGQIFSSQNFTGYPASENGGDNDYGNIGGGPSYDPINAFHLAEYGFSLASHANNHAWDYGHEGAIATSQYLNQAGITVAGTGDSLAEARSAVLQERNNKRIAFIAAAGSHTPQSVAGPGGGSRNDQPRPGANVLRAPVVTRVSAPGFEVIKDLSRAQGQLVSDETTDITLSTGQHPLGWSRWQLSSNETGLSWDINTDDYTGIVESIRATKNSSDATVFSLHAHEADSGADDSYIPLPLPATVPAAYTRNISHAAIDAGADIVLIHGPHHLRGIEIYKGRPIFYSLSRVDLPIEWDDSVVAITKFNKGKLHEIALYPIVHSQLTNDTSLPDSHLPKLAPSPQAQRILRHLQRVSKPFGTEIVAKRDVGYVKLAK